MVMNEYEIREKFRKNKGNSKKSCNRYIRILSELNNCHVSDIKNILEGKPVENVENKARHKREKPVERFLEGNPNNSTLNDKNANLGQKSLIKEALCFYACSLHEDNEGLRALRDEKDGEMVVGIINAAIKENEKRIKTIKEMYENA